MQRQIFEGVENTQLLLFPFLLLCTHNLCLLNIPEKPDVNPKWSLNFHISWKLCIKDHWLDLNLSVFNDFESGSGGEKKLPAVDGNLDSILSGPSLICTHLVQWKHKPHRLPGLVKEFLAMKSLGKTSGKGNYVFILMPQFLSNLR